MGTHRVTPRITAREIELAEMVADRTSAVLQLPHNPDDERWVDLAECTKYDPEIFFPISEMDLTNIEQAKAICSVCPVHAACRALRYDQGGVGSVWGGVYYPEGSPMSRPCVIRGCSSPAMNAHFLFCGFEHAHSVKVGTMEGYNLHARFKVSNCPQCSAAKERNTLQRKKYVRPSRKDATASA